MWRALGIMLAGLVLLAGFAFGAIALDERAAEFEARGTRVPGVVVGVHGGFRQSWTADVRYRVGNVEKEGTIRTDSNPTFKAGDSITVIYDPSDQERIAAPGFPNDPTGAVVVMALALLAGLSTFIVGLVRLVRAVFTRPRDHAHPSSPRTWRSRFPSLRPGRHARVRRRRE